MIDLDAVSPGDYFVTEITGWGGFVIGLLEWLDKFDWKHPFRAIKLSRWRHAGIYLGNGKILEAEPGKQGAEVNDISRYLDGRPLAFSTGKLNIDAATLQRIAAIAVSMRGSRYAWLDYVAVGMKKLRLPMLGWVTRRVSSSHKQICSQLVAYVYMKAGHSLFDTWTGDVLPYDLAEVIV